MIDYYDRQGNRLDDMLAWAKLFENPDYKRVAQDILPDGKRVSTVWIGVEHGSDADGRPLIFETMVFSPNSFDDLDCERYATEANAEMGHARMVAKYIRQAPHV